MSMSPLAYADSLRIGTIDFVSPDEIKVLLDIEAPDGVALNTGTPRPFPRINGYVLIPSDEGHLVAQVEWITIERSQYPKRKGMQDFGLVDLPYPLRKMSLNPLGVLAYESKDANGHDLYRFRRGVESYPHRRRCGATAHAKPATCHRRVRRQPAGADWHQPTGCQCRSQD